MIKASIRELSPERITISLRNKQIHREFFTEDKKWAIEGDQIESGFVTLYRSLVAALKSPYHKRSALACVHLNSTLCRTRYSESPS